MVITGQDIKAEFLNRVSSINKQIRGDGSGNISFGSTGFYGGVYGNTGMEGFGGGMYGASVPLSFYDIPNAADTYKQITEIAAKA
jgi:hypothetical protein